LQHINEKRRNKVIPHPVKSLHDNGAGMSSYFVKALKNKQVTSEEENGGASKEKYLIVGKQIFKRRIRDYKELVDFIIESGFDINYYSKTIGLYKLARDIEKEHRAERITFEKVKTLGAKESRTLISARNIFTYMKKYHNDIHLKLDWGSALTGWKTFFAVLSEAKEDIKKNPDIYKGCKGRDRFNKKFFKGRDRGYSFESFAEKFDWYRGQEERFAKIRARREAEKKLACKAKKKSVFRDVKAPDAGEGDEGKDGFLIDVVIPAIQDSCIPNKEKKKLLKPHIIAYMTSREKIRKQMLKSGKRVGIHFMDLNNVLKGGQELRKIFRRNQVLVLTGTLKELEEAFSCIEIQRVTTERSTDIYDNIYILDSEKGFDQRELKLYQLKNPEESLSKSSHKEFHQYTREELIDLIIHIMNKFDSRYTWTEELLIEHFIFLKELLRTYFGNVMSLDEDLSGLEGKSISLYDLIENVYKSPNAPLAKGEHYFSPDKLMANNDPFKRKIINNILSHVASDRDIKILEKRAEGKSMEDIGREFNLSREYISKTLKRLEINFKEKIIQTDERRGNLLINELKDGRSHNRTVKVDNPTQQYLSKEDIMQFLEILSTLWEPGSPELGYVRSLSKRSGSKTEKDNNGSSFEKAV